MGPALCLPVYYEQLVLHPEKEMRKVLKFVNISWDDSILQHEKYIGKKILLSKSGLSTNQVIKPINLNGLTNWVGKIPQKFKTF